MQLPASRSGQVRSALKFVIAHTVLSHKAQNSLSAANDDQQINQHCLMCRMDGWIHGQTDRLTE
jgi:hypothetical protein